MAAQMNFNNQKDKLTEDDIDQIVKIVGSHCRAKTLGRLRSILTYHASSVQSYGILERLMKEGNQWSYCASPIRMRSEQSAVAF